jgi:hypothetical protein
MRVDVARKVEESFLSWQLRVLKAEVAPILKDWSHQAAMARMEVAKTGIEGCGYRQLRSASCLAPKAPIGPRQNLRGQHAEKMYCASTRSGHLSSR